MKTFLQFLEESILDPRQMRLSSEIFYTDRPAKLKPLVQAQIRRGLAVFKSVGINVVDYRLIGSILTHQYTSDSDLDINVLVDGSLAKAVEIASFINGKPVFGTKHQINFHVLNQRAIWEAANKDADGVFNVETNQFEREPSDRPFDVTLYWQNFTRIASTIDSLQSKLKEAVLDYDALKMADPNDLRHIRTLAMKKVQQIESAASSLNKIYKIVKTDRASVFSKELTQKDIILYGEKNRMPSNVIYKLLEKYHYLKLLNSISNILGHDNSLSPTELNQIRQIFNPTRPS